MSNSVRVFNTILSAGVFITNLVTVFGLAFLYQKLNSVQPDTIKSLNYMVKTSFDGDRRNAINSMVRIEDSKNLDTRDRALANKKIQEDNNLFAFIKYGLDDKSYVDWFKDVKVKLAEKLG